MSLSEKNVKIIDYFVDKIKKENLDPIYFVCGEDAYAIENFVDKIVEVAKNFLNSDLDKETISLKDAELSSALSAASAYPFDSEKKLVIVKDFKPPKNLKELLAFINDPPDFSITIFIQKEPVEKKDKEPYATFIKKGYYYEAKALRSQSLVKWIISFIESNGKKISKENAEAILEIVGDDRLLLDSQLRKIILYANEKSEITLEDILNMSSRLKEYTIFDLQKAIAAKDKQKAFEYGLNLLKNGAEILFIIAMLTKYFLMLAQIRELERDKIPHKTAAAMLGIREYFYQEYLAASKKFDDLKLLKISRALLNLDMAIKTSDINPETAMSILLGEILE